MIAKEIEARMVFGQVWEETSLMDRGLPDMAIQMVSAQKNQELDCTREINFVYFRYAI